MKFSIKNNKITMSSTGLRDPTRPRSLISKLSEENGGFCPDYSVKVVVTVKKYSHSGYCDHRGFDARGFDASIECETKNITYYFPALQSVITDPGKLDLYRKKLENRDKASYCNCRDCIPVTTVDSIELVHKMPPAYMSKLEIAF